MNWPGWACSLEQKVGKSRRVMRCLFILGWTLLLTGLPATAGIVINEIFCHAPNDLGDSDYLELYNPEDRPVELGGWKFTKGIQGGPSGRQSAARESDDRGGPKPLDAALLAGKRPGCGGGLVPDSRSGGKRGADFSPQERPCAAGRSNFPASCSLARSCGINSAPRHCGLKTRNGG